MLQKPHESLTGAAKFNDFLEYQRDGFLHTAVRILLEPICDLHNADRGSNHKFAALGFLVTGRERALAQQVQFIFVETGLQAEQEAVIALSRRIDGLLVNQNSIDDAAHLDELLPVPAVAGKSGHLPCSHSANLAKANLGDHPFKAGACDGPGG
ncbi:hypothetical protein NSU_4905 [Novosphingobium pentaromativorans US6-1]|uniref:Uncharacterized protein n=1 Tax=Novosphingobium pentaromativorans US6-1 TaxID=1088721 RepID=G6EKN4_9SPHN|nr:hypothetical protein NSU_4905 [Novosphingobium pentaromativorans US6-1]